MNASSGNAPVIDPPTDRVSISDAPVTEAPVEAVPTVDAASVKADLLARTSCARSPSRCAAALPLDDLVQETLVKAWANLASFRQFQYDRLAVYDSSQRVLFGIP